MGRIEIDNFSSAYMGCKLLHICCKAYSRIHASIRQYTQTTWKNVKQVILMQFDDDQLHTFAIILLYVRAYYIYIFAVQPHARGVVLCAHHLKYSAWANACVCTCKQRDWLSEKIYKNMG